MTVFKIFSKKISKTDVYCTYTSMFFWTCDCELHWKLFLLSRSILSNEISHKFWHKMLSKSSHEWINKFEISFFFNLKTYTHTRWDMVYNTTAALSPIFWTLSSEFDLCYCQLDIISFQHFYRYIVHLVMFYYIIYAKYATEGTARK